MLGVSRAVAFAQALIACRSVTPDDDGALAAIEGWLTPYGFEVHRPVFEAEGTPSIENLYARLGTGSPCLVFAGHTDVVPPGPEEDWREPPFSGRIVDGVLWGRGAADMKGGVAASLAAVMVPIICVGYTLE